MVAVDLPIYLGQMHRFATIAAQIPLSVMKLLKPLRQIGPIVIMREHGAGPYHQRDGEQITEHWR
jgi:hypothetical protein